MRSSPSPSLSSGSDRTPNGQSMGGMETPMSSISSVERDTKRRKIEDFMAVDSDERKPVFLKMSFKKNDEPDEPDTRIEDDETFNARPWQEKSTMVPLLLAFRTRFAEFFDGVPDIGPQDIEEGVESVEPSPEVQEFMCRLLTLAANRAKPVEYPHYNRPLSDCVALHCTTRGDPAWEGSNPLGSNKRFPDLSPDDRLRLICCLLDWSLTESKAVKDRIEEAYKNRTATRAQSHNPYELDVIGRDDKKHGYYLIKGQNTRFRLYVQTDLAKEPCRWYSICSTLEELRSFTSHLSDTAKTVRCRKIVDDLASIHIPEVERAEEARKQILSRKQRAVLERTRRAAYADELSSSQLERSSRTRGRRIDYNNMLQGQGEDDDGTPYSKSVSRTHSTDSFNPQSTRSGRMLKRPRGWEDASPDGVRRTLINSPDVTSPRSMAVFIDEDEGSHIVILKYSKEKYAEMLRNPQPLRVIEPASLIQKRQKVIDSIVVPEPLSLEQQSLEKLYGPQIAAQMMRSKTAGKPVPVAGRQTEGAESTPAASSEQAGAGPDSISGPAETSEQSAPMSGDGSDEKSTQHSQQSVTSLPMQSTDAKTSSTQLSSYDHALLLLNIDHHDLGVQHLYPLLEGTIIRAVEEEILNLRILVHMPAAVCDSLKTFSDKSFQKLQKAISSLYVQCAKLIDNHKSVMTATVMFEDWCGYDLAQQDLHWALLGCAQRDEHMIVEFVSRHKERFPTRKAAKCWSLPIPAANNDHSDASAIQESRRLYDNVAVGGTFDHLHAGHKILLTMTAWLAQKKLICGVTDDALLVNKKHKEFMQNIQDRSQAVQQFFDIIKSSITCEIVSINDVAGPTGSDATIQALVASRETEAGSDQIREIRRTKGLPSLDILFIDVIGPDGEVSGSEMASLKLSSTAIRQKLASKL